MFKAFLLSLLFLTPSVALAHCPLCTAGAGVIAVLASYLGVSSMVIGVFLGAFAWALGLWLAGLVKTNYLPAQKFIITLLVFLLTIVPILPLIYDFAPLYIAWFGHYGSLMHNTYIIDLFVWGSIAGAVIVAITPLISQYLSRLRGGKVPFQGMITTIVLLVLVSIIIELLI